MTLWDLKERLESLTTGKAFEKEMWRYMQSELTGVLLYYQNQQLFKMSVGADKHPLGFYKSARNVMKKYGVSIKKAHDPGTSYPFKMVETGSFKRGMRVIVDRRSKTIDFTSNTPHLQEMLSNINNQFMTTNFFGLIWKHQTNFVNLHVKPHMLVWNIRYLNTGKVSR